jgi:hypothetical protein
MGQYYKVVNIDRKEYLHPHKFGEGLKLLEFGCDGMGLMTALACLLADGNGRGGGDLRTEGDLAGSWAGDRIVIAGDYADEGNFLTEEEIAAWREAAVLEEKDESYRTATPTLYSVVNNPPYEDISEEAFLMICEDRWIAKTIKERVVSGWSSLIPERVKEAVQRAS